MRRTTISGLAVTLAAAAATVALAAGALAGPVGAGEPRRFDGVPFCNPFANTNPVVTRCDSVSGTVISERQLQFVKATYVTELYRAGASEPIYRRVSNVREQMVATPAGMVQHNVTVTDPDPAYGNCATTFQLRVTPGGVQLSTFDVVCSGTP